MYETRTNNLVIYLNFAINILFFLIAIMLTKGQLDSVLENSTFIEMASNRHGIKSDFMSQFESVFGYNKLLWLLPITGSSIPNFTEDLYEETYFLYSRQILEIRPEDHHKYLHYIRDLPNLVLRNDKGK
ncbi:DHHC zinc finger domain-containing protein [Cryptosporidium felis]|nr:DHHC zinc finger domain-containing protein [Cryptosporidium felis]